MILETSLKKTHGKEYLPEKPNNYTGKKAKNAQGGTRGN